jgi:DUF3043 family protein
VFRRRTQPEPEVAPQPTRPGGKGKPTPKRREAEQARRRTITAPPKDRKDAYRQLRERQAADRAKAREGMARGDEKYLLQRDKGPVRRFARDFVDSRRTVGSYLMYAMMLIVPLSFVRSPVTALLMLFGPPLLLGIVLVEGYWISSRVKRLTAERFPGESRKGVGLYAAVRSMQIRRLRMPKPTVAIGERPDAQQHG